MNAAAAGPYKTEHCVCVICARPGVGLGFVKRGTRTAHKREILWLCDDQECWEIAAMIGTKKQKEFARLDGIASADGVDEAGAYLDTIGKTDLATLTREEWLEFGKRVVAGYRGALKGRLSTEAPF